MSEARSIGTFARNVLRKSRRAAIRRGQIEAVHLSGEERGEPPMQDAEGFAPATGMGQKGPSPKARPVKGGNNETPRQGPIIMHVKEPSPDPKARPVLRVVISSRCEPRQLPQQGAFAPRRLGSHLVLVVDHADTPSLSASALRQA